MILCERDLCDSVWNIDTLMDQPSYDLCFSIAVLEHIPESKLEGVIKEMKRTCKRGFHGIDFGSNDDGFDKTHITLRDKIFWQEMFAKYAPGWPVEILDKQELEAGVFPESIANGDGKVKLNIGCGLSNMFHNGWINIDISDFAEFAAHNGYKYMKADVRQGLHSFPTGSVDLLFLGNFLQCLNYDEAKKFIRECRRIIKPSSGMMRIIVPDGEYLTKVYQQNDLDKYDELNESCGKSPTAIGKLYSLLYQDNSSLFDIETLCDLLENNGWEALLNGFRRSKNKQILSETLEYYAWYFIIC